MIEQKTEQFKQEAARKLELEADDIKNDKSKSHIYYFNVDLKFILKARMHLLSSAFEQKLNEARKHGNKYKCYHCDAGDENEYFEVDANSMQMKCPKCKNPLDVVEGKNKLGEEDQKRCR